MKSSAVLSLLLTTALAAPRNTFQGVDLSADAKVAERQLDILNGIPIVGPLLSGLLGGGKGAGGALDGVTGTVGGLTSGLLGGDGSKSSKGKDSKGGLGDTVSGATKDVGDTVSDVTKGLGVRDLGDTVSGATKDVGDTVSGATKGLGDTVSGATKGVGVRDEMMIDGDSRVVERQLGGASGGPSLGSIFTILDKIIGSVGDKVPELKDPAKKVTDALDSFKEAAAKVDPSKLKMAMPTTN